MHKPEARQRGPLLALLLVTLAGLGLAFVETNPMTSSETSAETAKPNRYIGAAKCKNCHSYEEAGNQYGTWQEAKHSKAWHRLGEDPAKKVAADLGIDDPQKSDRCLKCHTTAFGEPEEMIKRGFDIEQGVQCETCHGPGELHMKARFAAAAMEEDLADDELPKYVRIPEDELIFSPPQETCLGCHNDESPSFKSFCFFERVPEIRHLDPRKPRTAAELDALLVCGCEEPCGCITGCPDDGCGIPPSKKAAREQAGG